MSKVVQVVSKTTLDDSSKYLLLEICVENENDEEVIVPSVRFKYR